MRIKAWLLTLTFLFSSGLEAKAILNLYTYPAYFPPSVLKAFEKRTHIHVNVSTIDGDNNSVFAKLQINPRPAYDLVVVTNYSLARFENAHLLQPLDRRQLPQSVHLQKKLLDGINPRDQWYALPWVWGSTGILVNRQIIDPRTVTQWKDLWQPRFRNQLLLVDSRRDVFAMSQFSLHESPNSENRTDIEKAYQHLLALKPNIRLFNSENIINLFVDEDIQIGVTYSGEAYLASKQNPNLKFIYPNEGFPIWVDTLVMVHNAPHTKEAYQFMNFICEPGIAKIIMEEEGVITANQDVLPLLSQAMQGNPMINPSPSILKRGIIQTNIGHAEAFMLDRWQRLKLALAS